MAHGEEEGYQWADKPPEATSLVDQCAQYLARNRDLLFDSLPPPPYADSTARRFKFRCLLIYT